MKIEAAEIGYRDGGTHLTGEFFFDSEITHRRPGVLVVHRGAGLDDHTKEQAVRLAKLGFVAFACDMYGDGLAGNRELVLARINELRRDVTKLCQRARAGIEVLLSHPQVDGRRVAVVGYCFGGLTSLELARSGADLSGVISIHGSLHTSRLAQPGMVKAKILVCHGALDPHVPITQVNEFVQEMNQAGADWQLIVYGMRCTASRTRMARHCQVLPITRGAMPAPQLQSRTSSRSCLVRPS